MAERSASSPSVVARLASDQTTARHISDRLGEALDAQGVAASLYEEPDGRWSLALYFRDPPDQAAVRSCVTAAAGKAAAEALVFETLEAKDWVRASLEGLTPVTAGRFVVHTPHHRGAVRSARVGVEIEAALAFGTGHHASTRGCLIALDWIARRHAKWRRPAMRGPERPRRTMARAMILDVGTGSGVLAIAAAKALRARVLASDIDPRAVRIARDNARLNRVGTAVEAIYAAGAAAGRFRQRAPFAVILANILLEPLKQLATPLARLLAPNGAIVLSGLLTTQARTAAASYGARGLRLARRIVLGGWTTLVVVRPALRRAGRRASDRTCSRRTKPAGRRARC
jgi:ribosomal protein L11 methyltransferase